MHRGRASTPWIQSPIFPNKLSSSHNSRVMRQGSGESGPRTYTFLYTDIVGSSRLWEADPTAMAAALASHNEILESAVAAAGGRVFKSLGDGLACVFDAADAAVRCAVEMQRTLIAAQLPGPIEIRIGVHSGTAHPVGNDFGGPVLNRVSRITDLAESGQIFISEAAQSLAKDYVGLEVRFDALGEVVLEGMTRPEKVFCVRAEGLRAGEMFGGDDAPFPPSNLEGLSHPFIGRVSERKDLVKRLRDSDQRLITVVGFGGMGKTTLARQCGLDVREDFDGCAYWIECEPIRGRDELAAAALSTLGEVSETADSEESLVALIGDKRVLLIFDCFENIVTLGGFMDRLVRRCPNLKVLVTSRIVLGAEAEYLVELGGMSGKQSAGVESDAVELFLSHTARHSPAFGVKQTERTLVRRLVRDLEYVPLAIVICAGRLRYTPIKALHEQIQSSLLGTVKSVRDQAGRHSGLARVIQMSFDLLDEADQRALIGLALFEGSFTMEAAVTVLGGEASLAEQCVGRLRDHSLVSITYQNRLLLLDSVREFVTQLAYDRMEFEGSFLAFYQDVSSQIRSYAEAAQWLSVANIWRLEAANLRAAVRRALRSEVDTSHIALPIMRVLLESGRSGDMVTIAYTMLREERATLPAQSKIEIYGLVGIAHRRSGQLALARQCFMNRAELCLQRGDLHEYADSLLDLAVIELESGQASNALTIATQVHDMGESAGKHLASSLAAVTSLCFAKLGDKQQARQYSDSADKLLEGIPQAQLFVHKTLSLVLAECGDYRAAIERLTNFASNCLAGNQLSIAGNCLVELALILERVGSNIASHVASVALLAPDANPRVLRHRLRAIKQRVQPAQSQGVGRLAHAPASWQSSVRDVLTSVEEESMARPVSSVQSSFSEGARKDL